jgi:hypothetical protein
MYLEDDCSLIPINNKAWQAVSFPENKAISSVNF